MGPHSLQRNENAFGASMVSIRKRRLRHFLHFGQAKQNDAPVEKVIFLALMAYLLRVPSADMATAR